MLRGSFSRGRRRARPRWENAGQRPGRLAPAACSVILPHLLPRAFLLCDKYLLRASSSPRGELSRAGQRPPRLAAPYGVPSRGAGSARLGEGRLTPRNGGGRAGVWLLGARGSGDSPPAAVRVPAEEWGLRGCLPCCVEDGCRSPVCYMLCNSPASFLFKNMISISRSAEKV